MTMTITLTVMMTPTTTTMTIDPDTDIEYVDDNCRRLPLPKVALIVIASSDANGECDDDVAGCLMLMMVTTVMVAMVMCMQMISW